MYRVDLKGGRKVSTKKKIFISTKQSKFYCIRAYLFVVCRVCIRYINRHSPPLEGRGRTSSVSRQEETERKGESVASTREYSCLYTARVQSYSEGGNSLVSYTAFSVNLYAAGHTICVLSHRQAKQADEFYEILLPIGPLFYVSQHSK